MVRYNNNIKLIIIIIIIIVPSQQRNDLDVHNWQVPPDHTTAILCPKDHPSIHEFGATAGSSEYMNWDQSISRQTVTHYRQLRNGTLAMGIT